MDNKKVIIIGAGVSGLVSAVYARRCGFDVTVYEKNPNIGGGCCGWERRGNYIDGCIHWLQGTLEDGSVISEIWKLCGVTDCEMVRPQIYSSYEFDGERVDWYTDLDKLEAELLSVAPGDKRLINSFVRKVKNYKYFPMPAQKPVDLYNIFELLGIGVRLGVRYLRLLSHSGISVGDYAKKFKSPLLRKVFSNIMPPKYNLMSALFMFGAFAGGDGKIPLGGSQAVSERIGSTVRGLGGEIVTDCGIKSVVVENGAACGVVLESGETVRADYVISTVDATLALDKLLGGKYPVSAYKTRNADIDKYPVYTYTLAAIKVRADVSHLPHNKIVEATVETGSRTKTVSLRNYCYDPSQRGDDGSTVMQVGMLGLDEMYEYWKAHRTAGTYRERKAEIGRQFCRILEEQYPELVGKTEVIDVVTPLTYERYLGTRHGTFQAYVETANGKALGVPNHIRGLKNFVLSGQWTMRSGGLPTAGYTGRFAVQRLCAWEKIEFVGDRPRGLVREAKRSFAKKAKPQ